MPSGEIRVADVGTIFETTIKEGTGIVDISTATTKDYIFCAPDETITVSGGSFKTDGTDGILRNTAVSGFLSQAGKWQYQIELVLGTSRWKTDTSRFTVHPNLQ